MSDKVTVVPNAEGPSRSLLMLYNCSLAFSGAHTPTAFLGGWALICCLIRRKGIWARWQSLVQQEAVTMGVYVCSCRSGNCTSGGFAFRWAYQGVGCSFLTLALLPGRAVCFWAPIWAVLGFYVFGWSCVEPGDRHEDPWVGPFHRITEWIELKGTSKIILSPWDVPWFCMYGVTLLIWHLTDVEGTAACEHTRGEGWPQVLQM